MHFPFVQYLILLPLLFLIELLYFKVAEHFQIIDKPNERSSHTKVTLRGGGVLFVISILLYTLFHPNSDLNFCIGMLLLAIISFIDDLKTLSSRLRLGVHLIAILFLFLQWDLFSYPWFYSPIALLLCVYILNAYNFMDGINGITGGYSLVVLLALIYTNNYHYTFVSTDFLYYILCALLVFNFFNFRTKAKCFAGDVGSITIAFALLFLIGQLILTTGDPTYLIFLVVYGTDSSLTILHRLIRKEDISKAHRKHAYQLLANELKVPHLIVSTLYMLLQACILIGYFFFFEYRIPYCIGVILLLGIRYLLFMKRYFHLHLAANSTK